MDGVYQHCFDVPAPADRIRLDRFHELAQKRRMVGLTYAEADEMRVLTIDLETVGLVQRIR